jgi:hypothetical protein
MAEVRVIRLREFERLRILLGVEVRLEGLAEPRRHDHRPSQLHEDHHHDRHEREGDREKHDRIADAEGVVEEDEHALAAAPSARVRGRITGGVLVLRDGDRGRRGQPRRHRRYGQQGSGRKAEQWDREHKQAGDQAPARPSKHRLHAILLEKIPGFSWFTFR